MNLQFPSGWEISTHTLYLDLKKEFVIFAVHVPPAQKGLRYSGWA